MVSKKGDAALPLRERISHVRFFDEEAQVRVQMLKIIGVIAAVLNVAAISGCFKSW
jgi:hypothetical protein